MAFRHIENISINGSKKAFNGYVYNVDYEISFSDSPSKLVLHFLSEDGTFSEPSLSAKVPYKIDIGQTINQNFYAVSYTENRTTGGKTLSVTFFDGSIILDNLWVGLHKRHGINPHAKSESNLIDIPNLVPNPYPKAVTDTIGSSSNLIIVGSESHPCDLDENGVFDENDLAILVYNNDDVCNIRCNHETIDVNALQSECVNMAKTEIFDITYTFAELLEVLPSYIKINQTVELENSNYKGMFTGPLREVLRSWCALYGLNFYWENDGISFGDVSKQPKISFPSFECIETLSHTKTLEGTVSRGAISHYSQPGRVIDKQCHEGQIVSLQCLTLRDLFTDFWRPEYGSGSTGQPDEIDGSNLVSPGGGSSQEYKDDVYPNGVPIERLEEACVCSYYDERLRWLYILRNYYGLNEIENFVTLKRSVLDRFGSMQILRVYDKYNTDSAETGKNKYDELLSTKTLFKTETNERETFEKNEGFFVLAKIDTRKLQTQFQQEENLAISFMGRHWTRGFHSMYYGENPEIKPQGQYIGAGASELKNAAFANFNHSNRSKVADLAQSLQNRLKISGSSTVLQTQRLILKDVKSVIYYDRPDGIWSPSRDSVNYFTSILGNLTDAMPRIFRSAPQDKLREYLNDELQAKVVTEQDFSQGKIVLLAMFRGYFTMSGEITTNPFEENPIYMPVAQIANAKLGLSSKRAVRYHVWGVPVDTPAGGSCRFDRDYNQPLLDSRHASLTANFHLDVPTNASAPYYSVVVVQTRTPHVEIPKIEATFVSPPPEGDTLRTDYTLKSQIDEFAIRALNKLQKECVPDVKVLQTAHEKFNQGLAYSTTAPYESYDFTIAGIDFPSGKIGVAQGLESLSIRLDDKGVFSTYRIGNSKFVPIGEGVLEKKLMFDLRLQKPRPQPFTSAVVPRKQV